MKKKGKGNIAKGREVRKVEENKYVKLVKDQGKGSNKWCFKGDGKVVSCGGERRKENGRGTERKRERQRKRNRK